jgi:hypothetical protein
MTQDEFNKFKKMLHFTEFSFNENKHTVNVYSIETIMYKKQLLDYIMNNNTQTDEGKKIMALYHQSEKQNNGEVQELDYNQIGLKNIQVIRDENDGECENLSFFFKDKNEYYFIDSLTFLDDDHYSLYAVKANTLDSLYQALPEMEAYCSHIKDNSKFLLPFVEKERLENKISSFRVKEKDNQEKSLKI